MVKKSAKEGSPREQYESTLAIKEDIVSNLRDLDSYRKSLKKVKTNQVPDPIFSPTFKVKKILTHTALDRILSRAGGIELGRTVEFWGGFGTGKTQIVESMVAEAEGLIIFIDGEHTFSPERLEEICKKRGKDPHEVSKRMMYFHPDDWIEQEAVIEQLPEFDENDQPWQVGLIALDSLMKHWRSAPEFYGRDKMVTRQQLIRNELENLARYARRHNGVFVFTNQIMDKVTDTTMMAPEDKVKVSGGPTIEHFADYRIFLRKGYGGMRFARLVDSIDLPLLEVPFILDVSGILDIPDPVERAKAVMLTEEYATKFKSGRAGSKEAGKDYVEEALKRGYIDEKQAAEQGLDEKRIQKAIDEQKKTLDDRLEELSGEERAALAPPEETAVEEEAVIPEQPKEI